MSVRTRLFASIVSPEAAERRDALERIARNFAHAVEMLEDGVLFDISGLERLMGKPDRVAQKILTQMKRLGVPGNVAVADTPDAAMLLSRKEQAEAAAFTPAEIFGQLPLSDLGLQRDTLGVFRDLGIKNIDDLLAVPEKDLIGRYGREFEDVIKRIRQKGDRLITPNVKESRVSWSFHLDHAVEDFEQLIFIVNHGLTDLFGRVATYAKSTEQLDISLRSAKNAVKHYEIKTSFPTLDKNFWLKLINLRVGLHPPEAAILSVEVTAHFTKPRPAQKGLYAVSRPEPESLLLTVGKLKKLVGEENVGVPVLLDQRLARPFKLEAARIPDVVSAEKVSQKAGADLPPVQSDPAAAAAADNVVYISDEHRLWSKGELWRTGTDLRAAAVGFIYYRPARPVEVLFRDKRIVYVRSREIAGHIANCSGVWRSSSKWWQNDPWKTQEWDVEIEGAGVYRIAKAGDGWFVIGEYD